MKDSQLLADALYRESKYIKANNERFSTKQIGYIQVV